MGFGTYYCEVYLLADLEFGGPCAFELGHFAIDYLVVPMEVQAIWVQMVRQTVQGMSYLLYREIQGVWPVLTSLLHCQSDLPLQIGDEEVK